MKRLILFGIILFVLFGCVKAKTQKEVILKFKSDIPIKVTVNKSCEGNWNFCQWE